METPESAKKDRQDSIDRLIAIANRVVRFDLTGIFLGAILCAVTGAVAYLFEDDPEIRHTFGLFCLLASAYLFLVVAGRTADLRRRHAWMARRPQRFRVHLLRLLARRIRILTSSRSVTLILVGSVAVGVPLWIATDGPSVTILTFVLLLPALALAHLTIGRIRDLPSFLRDQDTLLLRPDGSSAIANWSQDRSESTMLPDD